MVTGTLVLLALINILGFNAFLTDNSNSGLPYSIVFFMFTNNYYSNISMILAFLSMCIGSLSIIEDRSRGSLGVLQTKPLYKRDIIIGKFFGIIMFMLLFIIFTIILFGSFMLILKGAPGNIFDIILRFIIFIFLLSLNAIFTAGVAILFSIIFKNKFTALVLSVSYIFIEWLTQKAIIPDTSGDLQLINPSYLYKYTIFSHDSKLFDSTSTLASWFDSSTLKILLIIAEVIIVVLVCCIAYVRDER